MNLLFKADVSSWNGRVRLEQFQIIKETPKQYKVKKIDRYLGSQYTINKSERGYFTNAVEAFKYAAEKAQDENRKSEERINLISTGIAKIENILETNIPAGHWWDGETWTTSQPEEWIPPKTDEFMI